MTQYKTTYKQFEKFILSSPITITIGDSTFEYKKKNFDTFLKKGTFSSELEKDIFKKAANLLMNKEGQAETITVNIDTDQKTGSIKEIYEIAQIIAFDNKTEKPQNVVIESSIDLQVLNTILKNSVENAEIEDKIRNISGERSITWDIEKLSSNDDWNNIDFCVSKLNNVFDDKAIDSVFKTIPKQFFLQENFYEKLISKVRSSSGIMNKLDFSYSINDGEQDLFIFQNDALLSYVVNNMSKFTKDNERTFKTLLHIYISDSEINKKIEDNQEYAWSLKLRNMIKERELNTTEKVISFIESLNPPDTYGGNSKTNPATHVFESFRNYQCIFNKKVINDEEFLKFLNHYSKIETDSFESRLDIFNSINPDIYKNKEGLKKLITSFPDLIFTMSYGYEEFFKSTIKSLKKEDICDIIRSMKKSDLTNNFPLFCGLFKTNNKNLMDKEVFVEILKNTEPNLNVNIASYADSEKEMSNLIKHLKDPNIFELITKSKHVKLLGLLDFEKILEIKDLKLVSELLVNDSKLWLKNQKSIPEHWFDEPLIIEAFAAAQDYSITYETIGRDFINNILRNKDHAHIIAKNNFLFSKIANKVTDDISVYCTYIRNHRPSEVSEIKNQLPHFIWSNHTFCVKALESDVDNIKHIDKDTLKDNEFLKKLFTSIDSNLINEKVLVDINHKILPYMDAAKVQRGNYLNFFNKTLNNELLNEILQKDEVKTVRKKI